jgi:hypothetical protein
MQPTEITNRFTYHAPNYEQIKIHNTIRNMAYNFASYLNGITPDSPEKDMAINKLDEAVMWANAAVARNSDDN